MGVFRSRHRRGRRSWLYLGMTLVAVAAALVFVLSASASHPEVSLPGSNFEIDTDANLKVDDPAPSIDWASVAEARKADKPSGANDDSFGQGTKEDTAVPTVVSGSIPPQKSDLLTFGVYLETVPNGGRFLNLFWHRVQEPQGTTNMDFEFNQSSTISGNGVTPVRTAGDLLVQYDLSKGGTSPTLFLSRWVTSGAASQCEASNSVPCWSTKQNLTAAGDATGSINSSAIPAAESDGLGDISPRTFGEAQLDFDALTGGTSRCVSFGSAYLKSRSSDSFTAELKDFIAPATLSLNQCGKVIIRKQTIPEEDPNTTSFGFSKTFPTDPATANTFTLMDDGVRDYGTTVLPGTGYTVDEDVIPANWTLANIDCNASVGVTPVIDVAAGTVTFDFDAGDVLDCTYTNQRLTGAIQITKTRKHNADGPGDHPHAGVTFTVNGVSKQTDANGVACFDGLDFGTYTVHETVPAGYAPVADQQVTVDNAATCAETPYVGETASFHNTPLTDVSITVHSQVTGGTSSTVDCSNDLLDGTGGDVNSSAPDQEPQTITCTITIDP
jgi:Prealbumin-like fold domain